MQAVLRGQSLMHTAHAGRLLKTKVLINVKAHGSKYMQGETCLGDNVNRLTHSRVMLT